MTARDECGDPLRAAEVSDPWEATDADRRSNNPRSRTTGAPKTSGGAPPEWADEWAADQ